MSSRNGRQRCEAFLKNRDEASLEAQAGRPGWPIYRPSEEEERVHASSLGSEHHRAVRVVRETDEIIAVCLEGELDLADAPDLGDQIDLALECGTGVIVDLSEATFIDSSIVSVLIQASKTAARRKQTVVLQLGTALVVERILQIVGIERVMPRANDRQEAVRIIRQQAQSM